MKKSILKNLVILSFAFGALFLTGNNVYSQFTKPIPEEKCTSTTRCLAGAGNGTGSDGRTYCCQTGATTRGYADAKGIR